MQLPEIAVNLLVFNQIPLAQALDAVRDAGCSVIELAYTAGYATFDEHYAFTEEAADRIVDELRLRCLTCRSVAAHIDLGEKDALERFTRRLKFAHRVGASIIISNTSTVDKREVFGKNIVELSKVAASLDLTIALENPGDGAGNLLDSGVGGARLVDGLSLSNVRLNYDYSNAISYAGMDLAVQEDCAAAVPRSVNLHLKDLKRDEAAGVWNFCAIGEGDHDYAVLLREVKRQDRPPYVSLELPLHMRRGPDLLMQRKETAMDREGCVQAIKQSVRNIARIWRTV
ncbi:MAG: sugar phosphate isomerase/epimerase family protein [Sphaerochaetaceae bacterium]|jgi:sugar phosphate isomerase/epimerase|nr:sugar phosphate isomerase/epimerase family protein [Sphaerochaetaceae bacterium]